MSQRSWSDTIGNQNVGLGIVVPIAVCMTLSALTVLCRFVSRRMQKMALSTADYLCLGGLIGAWIISLIVISQVKLGLGKHIEVVPIANIRIISITTYVAEKFYSIALTMIKLSILLFYRSIFQGRYMTVATNIVGVFVIMWGIAVLLTSIFSCTPIPGYWDRTIESKCINVYWFFMANSIPNIIIDAIILCLPMRKVWALQMSLRTKIAVSGVFLLGGFVVVASTIRVFFMLQMDMKDKTWSFAGVATWSPIEVNVAVMSACLPTMRPILRQLVPSCLARSSSHDQNITPANPDTISKKFRFNPNYKEGFHHLSSEVLLEEGHS